MAINGGLETDLQTGLAMEAACYAQVRQTIPFMPHLVRVHPGRYGDAEADHAPKAHSVPGSRSLWGFARLFVQCQAVRAVVAECSKPPMLSLECTRIYTAWCGHWVAAHFQLYGTWRSLGRGRLFVQSAALTQPAARRCCRRRTGWRGCARLPRSARRCSQGRRYEWSAKTGAGHALC